MTWTDTQTKNQCTTLIDVSSFIYDSCNTLCLDLHVIRLVFFSFCLVFCLDVACLWLGSCRDSLGFCLQGSGVCGILISNHLFCDHYSGAP